MARATIQEIKSAIEQLRPNWNLHLHEQEAPNEPQCLTIMAGKDTWHGSELYDTYAIKNTYTISPEGMFNGKIVRSIQNADLVAEQAVAYIEKDQIPAKEMYEREMREEEEEWRQKNSAK